MLAVTRTADVKLYLLGPPYLTVGGRRQAVPNKGLLLLARVVLCGPQNRDDLIRLLWPGLTAPKARNNLRVLLSALRQVAPGFVQADRLTVSVMPLWSDVLVLEEAALAGQAEPAPVLRRGPLLEGLPLPAGELADWVREQRARWHGEHPAENGMSLPGLQGSGGELVGRETDLAALLALVRKSGLVTLYGLGGVGKTALARTLARRLGAEALTVDLQGAREGMEVAHTLSRALGLSPDDDLGQVLPVLRRRPGVLILENADGLLPGGPVDELRASLPQHCLLLLRRRPLGAPGERSFLLAPLALPPGDLQDRPQDLLAASPAVTLFVARARRLCPDLRADAPAVAAICTLLDGLPRALEWAAAHCRVLSLDDLLGQLRTPQGTAHLLAAGPETLETLLRPSLEGMSPADLQLLRRLTLLDVALTLEEMGQVLNSSPAALLPRVEALLAAGVLRPLTAGEQHCFEVLRLVGVLVVPDTSAGVGETGTLLKWLLNIAERGSLFRGDGEYAAALSRWARLEPALRRALATALTVPALRVQALKLCEALVWWWVLRGEAAVGWAWLEKLGGASTFGLGVLGTQLGRAEAPGLLFQVWEDPQGPPWQRGLAAALLSALPARGGVPSRQWLGRAQEHWAAHPFPWGAAMTLRLTALRSSAARTRTAGLRRAYEAFASLEDPLGMTLCAMETTALRGERRDELSLRRRVAEARVLGHPWLLAQELWSLCAWLLAHGRATEALPLLGEQLRRWAATGWRWGELLGILQLARAADLLGQRQSVSRLSGLAWVLRSSSGALLGSPLMTEADAQLADLPARLRSAAERGAWREARQVAPERVATEAYRLYLELRALGGTQATLPLPEPQPVLV